MNDEIHYLKDRPLPGTAEFSMNVNVIDAWLPIIGPIGYSLYSVYCRVAAARGQTLTAYAFIRLHLGLNKIMLAKYNHLLTWCGLIHLGMEEPGGTQFLDLLDPPAVTPEMIKHIHQLAVSNWGADDPFVQELSERLEYCQLAPLAVISTGSGDQPGALAIPETVYTPLRLQPTD